MNTGFHRYRLERQLTELHEQRTYLARFTTPTAIKKRQQADAEIAEIESLLSPKQPTPTPPTRLFVHPATGTTYNGF